MPQAGTSSKAGELPLADAGTFPLIIGLREPHLHGGSELTRKD
jgi:hypothetical protein